MADNNRNNDEFDDLKSLWQNQEEKITYNTDDIFKMIHRKSVNSIQWLFIITIIEVLLGIAMSLWTIFSGKHVYSDERIKIIGEDVLTKYENFSHLGLLGSLVLFGLTFYFYRKINSALSVKDLMSLIIRFRKLIMYFIIIWVIGIMILFTPIMVEMGSNTYLNSQPHLNETIETTKMTAQKVGYVMAIVTIVLILVFSAIYYGVIYGIFLRRLGRNLKELKNIQ
jgi:hypothetical protein